MNNTKDTFCKYACSGPVITTFGLTANLEPSDSADCLIIVDSPGIGSIPHENSGKMVN
jgi:hypothetical protein